MHSDYFSGEKCMIDQSLILRSLKWFMETITNDPELYEYVVSLCAYVCTVIKWMD